MSSVYDDNRLMHKGIRVGYHSNEAFGASPMLCHAMHVEKGGRGASTGWCHDSEYLPRCTSSAIKQLGRILMRKGEPHMGLPQRDNCKGTDSTQKSDYKDNEYIKYNSTLVGKHRAKSIHKQSPSLGGICTGIDTTTKTYNMTLGCPSIQPNQHTTYHIE